MRKRPPHVTGGFYHVTMRGNSHQAIFRDEEDRDILESCLIGASNYYDSEIHAYCWMTNHLHLLVRVSTDPVFKTVRYFGTEYARRFNRKYQSVGHVYQGRHHRRFVSTDAYLKQVVRYIHRNPVEARITADPIEYPWSSYRAYLGEARSRFLKTETVLGQFGSELDAARRALAGFTQAKPLHPHPWSTWREILAMAEARFNVCETELCGTKRGRKLVQARLWVVKQARCADLGSVASIAARLGRSASSLSRLLKRATDQDC